MSLLPHVSVVICTNVCDQYFDQALSSIERQSFENIEIVIVANSMSDETYQVLVKRATDPRTLVIRASIFGVSFSRNLALQYCRAPLVAVMDADDISYPERLATQCDFLMTHPEVVVCGSGYDIIDIDGKKLETSIPPISNEAIRKELVWRNPLCHPSTMFRTEVVRHVGGYCGTGAEDYGLWVRLAENRDWDFANINQTLIGYRVPVVSVARRSKRVYAHVAGIQLSRFAVTKQFKWLVASTLTLMKLVIRGERE